MPTIRMTVTSIAGPVISLDHQVADGEYHDDGYTGAELRLWFRDLQHVRQADGSTVAQKVEPGDLPLAVGQIVEVTLEATADTRPVEQFVDDDGDGIPDRRVIVNALDP